jgi:hypothetical protein
MMLIFPSLIASKQWVYLNETKDSKGDNSDDLFSSWYHIWIKYETTGLLPFTFRYKLISLIRIRQWTRIISVSNFNENQSSNPWFYVKFKTFTGSLQYFLINWDSCRLWYFFTITDCLSWYLILSRIKHS